ncbi:hypothetical protein ACH4RA_19070 [Streptomyces smyrnaeus]|uniref:hypothetical protein n=1 Tax=Streptomyces TaxID=1883 RepID=UPI00161192D5|nr:hypothetical protein [Streptomyces sp. RK75]MBQ0866184.1 hypothetical protein [Streptomyces sp. RK75]
MVPHVPRTAERALDPAGHLPGPGRARPLGDPHPDNGTAGTNRPGEGPGLQPVPVNWIAKVPFEIPAAADLDSIRFQATVLGADQQLLAYRLNDSAWMPTNTGTDAVGNFQPPTFTFSAQLLPGARAGANTLFLRIRETVIGPSAGLMAHLIATYQVPGNEQRSWTRMVCCDDSVYYIDEDGQRQETLPESFRIVPCGSHPIPLVLRDENGPFLRHVSYGPSGEVVVRDTDLDGAPYDPSGTVRANSDQ